MEVLVLDLDGGFSVGFLLVIDFDTCSSSMVASSAKDRRPWRAFILSIIICLLRALSAAASAATRLCSSAAAWACALASASACACAAVCWADTSCALSSARCCQMSCARWISSWVILFTVLVATFSAEVSHALRERVSWSL